MVFCITLPIARKVNAIGMLVFSPWRLRTNKVSEMPFASMSSKQGTM